MREASGSNPDISTPIFFFLILHACVSFRDHKSFSTAYYLSFCFLLKEYKIDTAYNIKCGVEKQAIQAMSDEKQGHTK